METTFTPLAALVGGSLIGLSAVLLMATLGRIMGATGVVGGLLGPASLSDWTWRAVLVAGMATGPLVYWLLTGSAVVVQVTEPLPVLIIGGLVVGFGASVGAGCTSGHGVCGMARLSVRSVAATLTFMAAAGLTVFVVRHVLGG